VKCQFAIISLVVLVLAPSGLASADSMDLALSRLRIASGPAVDADGNLLCNPAVTGRMYCAANGDWRRLMAQQGFALAPPILSPARTVGFRGFYLGLETGTTGIDDSQDYWHRGTEGDGAGTFGEGNRFVDSSITWMRLAMRKGLPFGFELGASIGRPFHSSLWMWGLSVKWSLLEGFDHGLPAIVPDFAVRGSVHTMTGDGQYNLTVPSLDLIVSKGIVIASQATFTPIIGAQLMWVVADSELVDLNPEETPAFDSCLPNPAPPTCVLISDPDHPGEQICDPAQSQVVRCTGPSNHFNDTAVFEQVRARRTRISLGFQLRFRALTIASSFNFDVKTPHDLDSSMPEDLPRQWNVSSAVGLTY